MSETIYQIIESAMPGFSWMYYDFYGLITPAILVGFPALFFFLLRVGIAEYKNSKKRGRIYCENYTTGSYNEKIFIYEFKYLLKA